MAGSTHFRDGFDPQDPSVLDACDELGLLVLDCIPGWQFYNKTQVFIDPAGDHRIAMAFGVMGAALGKVIIDGAECVAKTFPDFWETFGKVGGKIKRNA